MPLNILPAEQPITVETLVALIYGQPGIGKTSIAFTASRPLCLDFDAGAHRSAFRRDSVPVKHWVEVANMQAADLEGYDTVVVDTGGRCLDCITAHIAETQPKLTQASGALTLQGFGELKAIFLAWLKRLRSFGIDVIITAHDAEDKQGDEIIVRPDVQGGSKGELIKASDMIGYCFYEDGKRATLTFSPTHRSIGKNPAQLQPITLPDFRKEPDFMARVLQQTKDELSKQTEEQKAHVEALQAWKAEVDAITTVDAINKAVEKSRGERESLRDQAKRLVKQRASELGFIFDRDAMAYQAPETGQEPGDEQPTEQPAEEAATDAQDAQTDNTPEHTTEAPEASQEASQAGQKGKGKAGSRKTKAAEK